MRSQPPPAPCLVLTLVLTAAMAQAAGQAQQAPSAPEVAAPSFFAVSVADLAASETWYTRVLGVERVNAVASRDGRSRAVVMRRGELVVELIARAGSRAPEDTLPAPEHRFDVQGIVKTGIFVADADAWHEYLAGLDVEMDVSVFLDEALQLRSFIFRDPDGNRIQVFGPAHTP